MIWPILCDFLLVQHDIMSYGEAWNRLLYILLFSIIYKSWHDVHVSRDKTLIRFNWALLIWWYNGLAEGWWDSCLERFGYHLIWLCNRTSVDQIIHHVYFILPLNRLIARIFIIHSILLLSDIYLNVLKIIGSRTSLKKLKI